MESGHQFYVPVQSARRLLNPYRQEVWGTGPLSRCAIAEAIRTGTGEPRPNTHENRRLADGSLDMGFDNRRVAWLVENPASDAICIAWHVDREWAYLIVQDGCHRLSAAMFRGDRYILVNHCREEASFRSAFRKRIRPWDMNFALHACYQRPAATEASTAAAFSAQSWCAHQGVASAEDRDMKASDIRLEHSVIAGQHVVTSEDLPELWISHENQDVLEQDVPRVIDRLLFMKAAWAAGHPIQA